MIRVPDRVITHAPQLGPEPQLLGPYLPITVQMKRQRKLLETPATWEELHTRALTHEGKMDLMWLMIFTARISGGCNCKKEWKKELMLLPPTFKNYFFWTVAIHNMVNARLGKPQVTIDEARKIWEPLITPPARAHPAAAA